MTIVKEAIKYIAVVLIVSLAVYFFFNFWNNRKNDSGYNNKTNVSIAIKPNLEPKQALDALQTLKVSPKGDKKLYNRSDYGKPWYDVDNNNCDTRNDILNRDLTDKKKSGKCIISSGKLLDPYTGKTINFTKGNGSLVDIDHIVALGNVSVSGGSQLSKDDKLRIANDPENLIAVEAKANRAKGDKDFSEWPKGYSEFNKGFICTYASQQVYIKQKYKLSVTQAEKDELTKVLQSCSQ